MKKLMLLTWCTIILFAFTLPFTTAFASDPIIESIDQKLGAADPYYQNGSAKVMDFTDIPMDIAISEEEVEKQKVKMVFVKYQTDRDTIFHFNKQDIFYYSLDKNVLLENEAVIGNSASKQFLADHQDDYRKQLSSVSLAMILIFIFAAIIVFPLAVAFFHRNSPSDEMYHYDL